MLNKGNEQARPAASTTRTSMAKRPSGALLWAALGERDAAGALALLELGADPNVLGSPFQELGRTRRLTPLGCALDTLGDRLRGAAATSALDAGRNVAGGQLEEAVAAVALVVAMIDAGADPNAPGWIERPGASAHGAANFAMPTWLRFFHAFGGGLPGGNFGALAGSLMRKLVAGGLDVSASGPQGLTPLHQAAGLNLVEVAAALLVAGASVAVQDDDGETPLHRAAKGGHIAVARMLLVAGADPLTRDSMGCSAEDVAGIFGGQAMVALFAPHAERAHLARATPEADVPAKRARL